MGANDQEVRIERMARALASGAGVLWDKLDHYPGFLRNYWRNEARELMRRMVEQIDPRK